MKAATQWTSVLAPGDGDPRHGINGYTNLGCRCEDCRDAWSAYNRSVRRTRAKRIKADPSLAPHGVVNTYYNWLCRCDKCRAANRRTASARRARADA